ncbi:costars family protein ABRACL, partial [Biomphalaria pfeifferi]
AGGKYEVILELCFMMTNVQLYLRLWLAHSELLKKKKIIKYDGELSLQGVHDKIISLC